MRVKTPPAKRGRPKKTSLRTMQLRALWFLTDPLHADGLSLTALAKKAKVAIPTMYVGLGNFKPETRKDHDKRLGYKSLLSLGYVRVIHDDETGNRFIVTALGQREFNKLKIDKLPKLHAAPYSIKKRKKSTGKA